MLKLGRKAFVAFFYIVFFAMAGCAVSRDASLPSGVVKQIEAAPSSAIIETQSISVVPEEEPLPPSQDYVVGVNDALYININGKPELGSPAAGAIGKVQGSRVDGQGYIHLPLVGKIQVSGQTIEQVRDRLQKAYGPFIKKPWVVVEVADYRSQPIYLIGQFKSPGVVYLDRPINLLQGMALGSGLTDSADVRGARVIRNHKILTVDVYDLLNEGAVTQNVWLQPGDIVFVPDNKLQNIFVLGAVKRPGAIPMSHHQLSLVQAIAAAGGLNDAGYEERQLRIIRSLSTTRGALMTVDMKKMLRGEALPVNLIAGDIVYVPRSGLGDWNQALSEILPTLQTLGAILNPFVQIKFLSE